ncbi:IS3 family transposase [Luedemannella helvata]|uniref:Integrase catalytic domain-containing protein n=1 Tax=Luedemannella helvata TaxID=349315 RepID=A0ABP4X2D9_9ACTN
MSVAAFIASQRTEYQVPHAIACRALGVSESWFYKWRDRPPTPRRDRRDRLAVAVRTVFDASGGTYGSPRVGDELREQGWRVSDNTIAVLMAELGLVARPKRRRRGLTRQGKRPAAPDLIRRQFTAPAPDVAWCGDMTEINTDEGKLYLATVIDLYSRRILGYAMGERHDADLVVAALNMAAVTRGGQVTGVIFHSDRGSEYTSARFVAACARWGVRQSMGRVGSCFDNAVAEATFSTIKVEYVHRRHFATRTEARIKIATWITDFYNHRRRHSVCDGRSPIDYERSTTRALEARAA